MADSALQRKNMVESQVRPSDVTDRRITSAMQDLAREAFVPPALADLAYMDDPLTVAPGRSLMAPRTLARLLQLAGIEPTDKVLIVGALYGYSTAIVARSASHVVALESEKPLASAARAALDAAGITNATVVTGDLAAGWPEAAPYQLIIVDGAFERLPDGLVDQLAAGGTLVGIENSGGVGRAVAMQKVGAKGQQTVSRRVAFEAAAQCLPGFAQPKAFTF
jgi:protein-L-isoaspartate(D-aspartate) O-methyltransferase